MARYFWTIVTLLLGNLPGVLACEGCKEPASVVGASGVNGTSLGFSVSVIFMLGMVATILGGMLCMIIRACKQLDTQAGTAPLVKSQPTA